MEKKYQCAESPTAERPPDVVSDGRDPSDFFKNPMAPSVLVKCYTKRGCFRARYLLTGGRAAYDEVVATAQKKGSKKPVMVEGGDGLLWFVDSSLMIDTLMCQCKDDEIRRLFERLSYVFNPKFPWVYCAKVWMGHANERVSFAASKWRTTHCHIKSGPINHG